MCLTVGSGGAAEADARGAVAEDVGADCWVAADLPVMLSAPGLDDPPVAFEAEASAVDACDFVSERATMKIASVISSPNTAKTASATQSPRERLGA